MNASPVFVLLSPFRLFAFDSVPFALKLSCPYPYPILFFSCSLKLRCPSPYPILFFSCPPSFPSFLEWCIFLGTSQRHFMPCSLPERQSYFDMRKVISRQCCQLLSALASRHDVSSSCTENRLAQREYHMPGFYGVRSCRACGWCLYAASTE